MDRERLARYVARNLQDLPKGAGWSVASRTDGDDVLTEGDYTDSIDDALRELGFVDPDTNIPDAELAEEGDFMALAKTAHEYALERLDNFYATVTDTMGGPVRIYRSQVQKALQRIRGSGTTARVNQQGRFGVSVMGGLFELDQR